MNNILGKWKVVKVFKDFTTELVPQYVSKNEALELDQYKDEQSIKFITSTYEFTDNELKIIKPDGEVFETLKYENRDGKIVVLEGEGAEVTFNEDGTITFMIILVLARA